MTRRRTLTACLLLLLLAVTATAERALVLQGIRVEPAGGAAVAVRRLLPLAVGDVLDAHSLGEAQESLESSGVFESVHVYSERGTTPGAVVLVVEAKLDRGVHLQTGFGHQPIDGWYLDLIGMRWNSPFRRGGHLRLGLRAGQRTSGTQARLEVPRLLGSGDFLVELSGLDERWRIYEGLSVFEQTIAKSELLVGARFGETGRKNMTVWLGGSSAEPSETVEAVDLADDEPAGRLVPLIGERQRYGTLGLDLRLFRQHPTMPWREGRSTALRLRSYSEEDGARFGRADLEQAFAFPMPAASAFALQGRASISSPETPYYLRPVFGGTSTVRGYRDASLSGARGARAYWKLSGEWRMPLLAKDRADPRVLGVLFADAGRHWDADGERQEMSAGVGYGLRIRVPWLQIFSVDVGIPLSEQRTGDDFWAHLRLGYGF
jgi:hemolysin activation/secretion protein